jgi:chromosome segregation ATPase
MPVTTKEAVQMPEASDVTPETAEQGIGDLHRAAQTIGQNLSAVLCAITGLARLAEEVSALRADFASLRAEAGSQSEKQQLFSTRLAAIETALRAQEENQPRLLEQLQQSVRMQQESLNEKVESQSLHLQAETESVAQLQGLLAQLHEGQQALLKRLDAQAEALRALHHAAQAHATQKEDLRSAVQKLEMIAGAPNEVEPLPKDM